MLHAVQDGEKLSGLICDSIKSMDKKWENVTDLVIFEALTLVTVSKFRFKKFFM
jgi:hypothetical protein